MTVHVGGRYLQPAGECGKRYLLLPFSRLSLAFRQSEHHVAPQKNHHSWFGSEPQVSWSNKIIRMSETGVKKWNLTSHVRKRCCKAYRWKKEPKYVSKCSLAVVGVGVWVKTYCQRETWFLITAQLFADILHASITSFTVCRLAFWKWNVIHNNPLNADWRVWLKKISWLD